MITRIKDIIAYYGLSTRAFAMKCGLKDNTFSNQLNGMRELSLTTVNAILFSNEEISAEWLLRGKGSMLLQKEETNGERMFFGGISEMELERFISFFNCWSVYFFLLVVAISIIGLREEL